MPPGDYPVGLTVPYPRESSRLMGLLGVPFFFLKFIALIPVLFCLYFLNVAAWVVAWIAQFAILFTGKYPEGMHRFVTGFLRFQVRGLAFLYGLTDRYPPFQLRE